jgi:hypothetical protein
MLRKTLMAVAAAASMALALGTATVPAQAGVPSYINPGLTTGYDKGYDVASHKVVCRWKKVWRYGYWQRVKVCKRVYHDSY